MAQNMRELQPREVGITAFVGRFAKGALHVPAPVLAYFDVPGAKLCLKVQKEVLLACEPVTSSVPVSLTSGRLTLTQDAKDKLRLRDSDRVAWLERRNAFALKRIPPEVLAAFGPQCRGVADKAVQVRPLVRQKARPKAPRPVTARTTRRAPAGVSQVVDVEPVRSGNRIMLKKTARALLGRAASPAWKLGREVQLTGQAGGCPAGMNGALLALPDTVVTRLALTPGDRVALVERPAGLAVKKLAFEVRDGAEARAYDQETPLCVTRILETNPAAADLLPALVSRFGKMTVRHDVRGWLRGRETVHAWMARAELAIVEPGDVDLRRKLVEARLAAQQEDGSWDGEPMATARCLRELHDLGAGRDPAVRRGAEWLLARPESSANPGMFFRADRLVARQAEILEMRRARTRTLGELRFVSRGPSEARQLIAADDLIVEPCGTRIMWPNAVALDALLALGYEGHPRVQRAIGSLMHGYDYWCECNYQLGAGTHAHHDMPGGEELAAREEDCMRQFRFGGPSDPEQYLETPRASTLRSRDGEVYVLKMRSHIQSCEVVTTRALRHTRSATVRRAAAAHLWRFASVQRGPDGRFPDGDYMPSQAQMLQVFAGYDHPASHIAILRAMPWVVGSQNPDGSWGEGYRKDATTLAVVQALLRVHRELPGALGAWAARLKTGEARRG